MVPAGGSDRVGARVIESRLGLWPDNPVRWNDVVVLLEEFDGLRGLGTEYAIHWRAGAVIGVQLGLQLVYTAAGIAFRERGAVVQVHGR
jgi:hypothetical protein